MKPDLIRVMGVDSGGQGGPCPAWIFIHGTDIVDRGLNVLFFGLFSAVSPGRGLIMLFSIFFRSPLPPGNFSADALDKSL